MFFATPKLPRALLHILTVSNRTFVRDPAAGGQSRPVDEPVTSFWGIVMPLSNLDLKRLPEGSYTFNSQKLTPMTLWKLNRDRSFWTPMTGRNTPSRRNSPTTPSTRWSAISWRG